MDTRYVRNFTVNTPLSLCLTTPQHVHMQYDKHGKFDNIVEQTNYK